MCEGGGEAEMERDLSDGKTEKVNKDRFEVFERKTDRQTEFFFFFFFFFGGREGWNNYGISASANCYFNLGREYTMPRTECHFLL